MKEFFDRLFSGSFSLEYFIGPFREFSLCDALDIALLSVLFFAMFLFVRDRRAGRILWGVGLLVGVYAVAELFNFYGLRYLFGSFFGYGLVALVVIFQPEIRALVERLGSSSFRNIKSIRPEARSRSALSPTALDEIVLAVKHMAFSKTGAIIAIERTIKINEYAQRGAAHLNADISARLLQTIFYKTTPLHDGAVIIREGRIFAAGCCNLPLTQNTEPIMDLGTRHRAAVGASEDTDAVIIVVSEQTGYISLAVGGELYRNFNSVTLRRKLGELLGMQRNAQQGNEETQ